MAQEPPRTPDPDKTFVEGDSAGLSSHPQGHGLNPGSRIDTTNVGKTNPYQMPEGMLPSGDEQIPLASGVIAGVLGEGGMARIYKIWNERLEVYRAVKILSPAHRDSLKDRFETEAKITAKLHHPNIVEIYTVGEYNGLPYIEMELIEGESLDSMINKHGRLPAPVCTAIGYFIAEALAYAHSQEFLLYGKTYSGVIHRDLKPANIMISKRGVVKLMDFGIARPTETSLHTVEGNIVGTMQYLSPEQLDAGEIDARSDIYSFGAILYEILTGMKTFPQGTITNLMRMKATNDYRRFTDFGFSVPTVLAKVAETCLQFERKDRYSNADDLRDALHKAHNCYTSDPPQKVMSSYATAPDSFEFKLNPLAKRGISKGLITTLSIAGGVVAIGIVIIALMFSGEPDKIQAARQRAKETATLREKERANAAKVTPPPTPAEPKVEEPLPPPPAKKEAAPKPPPRKKRIVQRLSPLDALKKKYETENLLSTGKKALSQGATSDAATALQALPASGERDILLLEAYIRGGRRTDARSLLSSTPLRDDAQLDMLLGRLEEASGNDRSAIEYYQSALTKPSAYRSTAHVRKDALYYTAVLHDKRYRESPSAENRSRALTSWNVLKRNYMGTPSHRRYKEANQKMATIQ